MTREARWLVAALTTLVAVSLPLGASAQKGEADVKRTAWGEPDLTGAYIESTVVPLERPPELGTQEFYTPEESAAQRVERIRRAQEVDDAEEGTAASVHYNMAQYGLVQTDSNTSLNMRTSIVTTPANGRIPPLTPAAVARSDARIAANKGHEFDGPENFDVTDRCIIWPSTMAPILPRGYNSNLQIFQSPGYVIIQGEMGDPRIIPTDGNARDPGLPQWNGTSVGRWDGNTLVVETSGFNDETAWRGATANVHVTEWLTRIDEETVEYRFRVDDPQTWEAPWGGVYPLRKLDGLLFEYACTEGNYGLANILSQQRALERRGEAE